MAFREEVSVIIPTYNGAQKVLALLSNLSNQTFQDFKIYIGIDGSTDNTRKLLEGQHFFSSQRISIFEQSNQGRAIIRNRTASLAKGQILVFLDDDMEPEKELLEKHYKHHLEKKGSVIGGNQLDINNNKSDYLNYKSQLSNNWMQKYNNQPQLLNDSNLFLTAANFSIPNKLFKKLRGFDERLKDIEDWDFAVKTYEKGYNVYFDKTIIAYHINPVTLKEDIFRQREYNKAIQLLKKYNPQFYNGKYYRIRSPKLDFYRKIVYWIMARKYNVFFIDHFNIFRILPKRIRFLIYTTVKTGLGRVYTNRDI